MKTSFFIILLLFGHGLQVHAQTARYDAKRIKPSATDFADTIAIEWEREQIFLPVVMNGCRYRFLFDTGAAQTMVYADTPVQGSTPIGHIRSHDAIGRVDTVPVVCLPPMTLGSTTFSGCRATVQQRPVGGRNCDGIVGFDIVNSGINAKIDVRNNCLILSDRKNFFNHEQGFDITYKLKYHVPYITVIPFADFREEMLFDTGSRRFITMNKGSFDLLANKTGALLESQIEGRSVGRHAIGLSGTEPRGEVVFMNLKDLRVGDCPFTDVHTITTQGGSHLGAALLNLGTLVINPKRKRLRFQPYTQERPVRVGNKQTDIAFIQEKGMPCVGLVWERSIPYRQGFREGDIITQIDGFPVKNFTHFVVWPFIMGREYLFTVRDKAGRERQIRWVRIPIEKEK